MTHPLLISFFILCNVLVADKSSSDIQKDINRKNSELESLKQEIQKVEELIESKSKEEELNNEIKLLFCND